MFWLQAIVAVAIVCGTVLVASGRGSGTTIDELPDLTGLDPLLPEHEPVRPEDVTELRLGVGARGYRMDEVDEVLDRLTGELADRDATIERLSASYAGTSAGASDGAPAARDAATWGDPSRHEAEPTVPDATDSLATRVEEAVEPAVDIADPAETGEIAETGETDAEDAPGGSGA